MARACNEPDPNEPIRRTRARIPAGTRRAVGQRSCDRVAGLAHRHSASRLAAASGDHRVGAVAAARSSPPRGRRWHKNVCAACHGADGNSVDPDYPKLAGQSARYLYDQLLAFKAQGHRRASGVMGAMAVNLTDAEMRDVSAYFSAQLPRDTGPQNVQASPKLIAQGQAIYRQGIGGKASIPACASCHALSGAGLPPEFPRLAGQHEQYLVRQLAEFRSDRRNSNPNQMMSVVARKLTDADIQAVAGYIARMGSASLRPDEYARTSDPSECRTSEEQTMKTVTLSIAAGMLAATTTMVLTAAPWAATTLPGASASAATSTTDSRALLIQRMRKCKAMTGDEKNACQETRTPSPNPRLTRK